MKVRRVFVEKRAGFDIEARRLKSDLADFLGGRFPCLAGLMGLRVLNHYDVGADERDAGFDDAQFEKIVRQVFSEPQCDEAFFSDSVPASSGDISFAVEYLPGQYNQRSDSARQCAELVTGAAPLIRSSIVYVLSPGDVPISDEALGAVKAYLINPVDSREASMELPKTLVDAGTLPNDTPVVRGFISGGNSANGGSDSSGGEKGSLDEIASAYGLAMSAADLRFCRDYFLSINRDPTLAELRVLDTYWSDHCRHTTFNTVLEDIRITQGPLARQMEKALAAYKDARNELYGLRGSKSHPPSLMDMAVIGAKLLKKRGLASDVDESAEINACTIKVNAEFSNGSSEPWLLLFKNETHNHPTEIEPFGGAATCLGGAIRDPLSGRAFVHQAMRVTGGGDPRQPLEETLPGKLPQLKIAREASAGYASYGNQIGLATGQVSEIYHSGFLAKRMELGAVIAAVPQAWVRREEPVPGDLVILAGGKTGRDGIGGATGSSKIHSGESVESAGAEVQKGNAVEERKLQRLFRNPQVTRLVKRCNDFGAGGVSVAVGELAAGLDIDLDKVPKKYAGLDGTELAISESQERMAVVVAKDDADAFIRAAAQENIDALVIAEVTASSNDSNAKLRMKWQGKAIVDISRDFLNSNGAPRSSSALLNADLQAPKQDIGETVSELDKLKQGLQSLRSCSRRGLQERFDGSIGAASVLFPWGGSRQGTPECGIAAMLPSLERESRTASLMSFGYDPFIMEQNQYLGAKGGIREALAKFACMGGNPWKARLSLQEYFERPQTQETWGKPAAALLGALEAQLALGIPSIGGKDSMSGNYRDAQHGIDIAVPPTLVAFAAGTAPVQSVRSGSLSGQKGNVVILFSQGAGGEEQDLTGANTQPDEWELFKANMNALVALGEIGCVPSAYPVGPGGAALSLALMAFGNEAGLEASPAVFLLASGVNYQGSVLVEIEGDAYRNNPEIGEILRKAGSWEFAASCIAESVFRLMNGIDGKPQSAEIPLEELRRLYEQPLSKVYPQTSGTPFSPMDCPERIFNHGVSRSFTEGRKAKPFLKLRETPCPPWLNLKNRTNAPLVVLPVFPGTNCEWDMEQAFRRAGARTQLVIFKNRCRDDINASLRELADAIGNAQIFALSGGFSAGDEPEGSGKFIANVLRAPVIADALAALLDKQDGLVLGICNGFQALIKLGLVPYGTCRPADSSMPTLTFNRVGRHVSRMVRTRVMSAMSPWLALEEPWAVHVLPVSHGEGRLVIRHEEAQALFKNGQVPFCYVDAQGMPTLAEPDNPNGSDFAIEGLTSPDGRILGKMAHSERCGDYVHINIPGNKKQGIFEAGVRYFT
jgi:phosphoribosylformylglycinamidine synthase